MFNRSRRNLACWFTLSMGSIVIIFASLIYYIEAVDQLETTDRLLYRKARIMAASVKQQFYKNQTQINLDNVPLLGNNPEPLDSAVTYARWYNEQGLLVLGSGFGKGDPVLRRLRPVHLRPEAKALLRRLRGPDANAAQA